MPASAAALLLVQGILLAVFSFFAVFKYLYGVASLGTIHLPRVLPSGKRCAVVVVAFNERYVVEDTIRACTALSYPNKLVVLADDSTDPEIAEARRSYARSRGCVKVVGHGLTESYACPDGRVESREIDIWESADFVLFQRPANVGFKSGSLSKLHVYLAQKAIHFMYLLDADWHPQKDALEQAFAILEPSDEVAFVQTKRIARPGRMNLFQKLVAILEESCYFVDFQGRQRLGHPILFSGCCALLRLEAIEKVGGFKPGHLTEDLDLTNRLWLSGWKGVYAGHIVNEGEVPFSYDHFCRQQERWASGSSACLRTYAGPILTSSRLTLIEKLSTLRQNAYFFSNMFTICAFLVGFLTLGWIIWRQDEYPVELYLYIVSEGSVCLLSLVLFCVFSNFFGPVLMLVVHRRRVFDVLYLPMSTWYAWSAIHAYLRGNIKGMLGIESHWFRTPKLDRSRAGRLAPSPLSRRLGNGLALCALLSFYFMEGWAFGWFDFFAVLWLPSLIVATLK